MTDDISRIELPSGGWWDVQTRPTVRQVKKIQTMVEDAGGDPESLDYEVLAVLSQGWSFDGEITVDSIQDRRADDLVEVMVVFTEDVMPFLEGLNERASRLPNTSSKPSTAGKSRRSSAKSR